MMESELTHGKFRRNYKSCAIWSKQEHFLEMASYHSAGVVCGELLKALLLVAAYHVLSATGQQGIATIV